MTADAVVTAGALAAESAAVTAAGGGFAAAFLAAKGHAGSPAEPLSCKKIEILQFSGSISWYKILRPWGQWHLYYTLPAPILSRLALLQHRDLVGVGMLPRQQLERTSLMPSRGGWI